MAPILKNKLTKKPSTMKLLVLVSTLLASSSSAFSPQPIPLAVSTSSSSGVGTVSSSSSSSSSSALYYTVAADLPPQQRMSIEEQMRQAEEKMRQGLPTTTTSTTTKTTTTKNLPNMMTIDNWSDFNQYVLQETERLTLVRFHAPFCRACKAMAPQLDRFAKLHPHINFVQIAWNKGSADTTQLIRRLGVTKVPHGQLYLPHGLLVEEVNLGKQYFGDVSRIVDSYSQGSCDLSSSKDDDVNEYSKMYESPYRSLKIPGKRLPVSLS